MSQLIIMHTTWNDNGIKILYHFSMLIAVQHSVLLALDLAAVIRAFYNLLRDAFNIFNHL